MRNNIACASLVLFSFRSFIHALQSLIEKVVQRGKLFAYQHKQLLSQEITDTRLTGRHTHIQHNTMSSPPPTGSSARWSTASPPIADRTNTGLPPSHDAAAATTEGQDDQEDEEQDPSSSTADLPLTMTASLVLTTLPRDATAALAEAHIQAETLGGIPQPSQKIIVRFKAVGSAPPLPAKRELSRVSAGSKFEAVVGYIRRVLKVREGEGVCLYVNNCFAPALDEVVGNLWRVS